MVLGVAYPFGLRDVKVWPITNVVTETLGTMQDLPASRTFAFTEAEAFEELRGDDKLILSRGTGAQVNWDLEAGGLHIDVYKTLFGGVVTDSGVTPNQIKKIRKKSTESRPYFKIEGQAISDTGGDVHGVVFRCRATGDVEGSFADATFYLTKGTGTGFPSQAAASIDALYDLIYNETEAAIV
ncbi:MAG: hypothetical protein ACRD42_05120 [Nitrososphaeraceae archaeon]